MSLISQEVGSFLMSLFVPVVTGVLAAGLTARFALNRFYYEKWWEKKYLAYNDLIDRLFELKEFFKSSSIGGRFERQSLIRGNYHDEGKLNFERYYELCVILNKYLKLSPITLSNETKNQLKSLFLMIDDKNKQVMEDGWPREIAYRELSEKLDLIIDSIVLDAQRELHFK